MEVPFRSKLLTPLTLITLFTLFKQLWSKKAIKHRPPPPPLMALFSVHLKKKLKKSERHLSWKFPFLAPFQLSFFGNANISSLSDDGHGRSTDIMMPEYWWYHSILVDWQYVMILGNCQPDTRHFFYIWPHSVLKIIVYHVTWNFGYYPILVNI